MAPSLFIDTLEIGVPQKARVAGESGCWLWRHGEVGPNFPRGTGRHCSAQHGSGQRSSGYQAVLLRRAPEGLDCGSERHQKSYSRKPGFTETRFRPLARRREITFLPPWVFMRVRKPCFLLRLRRLGWNVRLGMKDSCS
jgi:hypothetical protein